MFCPKCGYEYRQGFTTCSDCDVSLVDSPPKPPEEKPHVDVRFVKVLSTFDPGSIAIIKSILEAEGITHFFQGENAFRQIQIMAGPARLMVREDEAGDAVEALRDLDLKFDY